MALSQAYWPIIFPSQHKARLTLTGTRLILPLHDPGQDGSPLADFGPAEGAAPLETEVLSEGNEHRTLTHDYLTGTDTYVRFGDTGEVTHLHTGITVRYENEDRFEIHPADPNSARATCRWSKHYSRGDWLAELDCTVTVEALARHWRITATLEARDADGVVIARDWHEDIPRDHV